MMILSLDLGTKTGFAIGGENGLLVSGSIDFKPKKYEREGKRFAMFEKWLKGQFRDDRLQLITYELVARHLGTKAAHMYGCFEGIVQKECYYHDISYQAVAVGVIKKHAMGKGTASKDQMIDSATAHFGKKINDDNEADALWLLDYSSNKFLVSTMTRKWKEPRR